MSEQLRIIVNGERVSIMERVCGKLEVVALENDTLVLKEAGRHVYSGQGRPWRYAGASYHVYGVERSEDFIMVGGMGHGQKVGMVYTVRELVTWPVRAEPKEVQ